MLGAFEFVQFDTGRVGRIESFGRALNDLEGVHCTQVDALKLLGFHHLKFCLSGNYLSQGHADQKAGLIKLASALCTSWECRKDLRSKFGLRLDSSITSGKHLMNFVVCAYVLNHPIPHPISHS